jgi:hypothetical protein
MRPAQPKNLATKTIVWPCASAPSINYSGRRLATAARGQQYWALRAHQGEERRGGASRWREAGAPVKGVAFLPTTRERATGEESCD